MAKLTESKSPQELLRGSKFKPRHPTHVNLRFLGLLVLVLGIVGCDMNPPESINFIVQWPIQQSAPDELGPFLKVVRESNKEMLEQASVFDPFRLYFLYGRMRLNWKSGLSRLHVGYDHYSETESGEWKEARKTFEISGNGKNLTIGELLFHIQKNTFEFLGTGDDFSFPEALELGEEEQRGGVPVYELFLGS